MSENVELARVTVFLSIVHSLVLTEEFTSVHCREKIGVGIRVSVDF